ncbi:hypothetical protein ACFPM7_03435 [Actinokineospora guangxiensis]|uniref:Uncharacterized protein n=1 Tax=Actinokineospora guangxiensis TaxID=1490288 RepID=A0ABW0EHC5_9PSEU
MHPARPAHLPGPPERQPEQEPVEIPEPVIPQAGSCGRPVVCCAALWVPSLLATVALTLVAVRPDILGLD